VVTRAAGLCYVRDNDYQLRAALRRYPVARQVLHVQSRTIIHGGVRDVLVPPAMG